LFYFSQKQQEEEEEEEEEEEQPLHNTSRCFSTSPILASVSSCRYF
jgi:hypothetical protein